MSVGFRWSDHGGRFCNSPVERIDQSMLEKEHPGLAFLEYWQGLNDGDLPCRSAFSPLEVKPILKWVMLFQRSAEAGHVRFQLTLHGTAATELTYGSRQGQYLDQFTEHDCYTQRASILQDALESGEPRFGRTMDFVDGEQSSPLSFGIFPFANEALPQAFLVLAPDKVIIRRMLQDCPLLDKDNIGEREAIKYLIASSNFMEKI